MYQHVTRPANFCCVLAWKMLLGLNVSPYTIRVYDAGARPRVVTPYVATTYDLENNLRIVLTYGRYLLY